VEVLMDADRQIRFLVAPILFVASLLLGALSTHTTPDIITRYFTDHSDWSKYLGLIAGGGVAVFAAGYVIGACTNFVLRLIFRYRPKCWGKSRFYEAALSDAAFKNVWERLGAPEKALDRKHELSAAAAFDHGLLQESHEGVHRWILRRWSAFSIAANSCCGLLLSLAFGHAIGIPLCTSWCIPVLGFAAVLVPSGIWAWFDTFNMVSFMASLPSKENTDVPK
jgi:hypothetical protein